MVKLLRQLAAWLRRGRRTDASREAISKINFEKLSRELNYHISDRGLFARALTHRSFLQDAEDDSFSSYERLEFLGDAILGLVVAQYLYAKHEFELEGNLTKMRARLVNRKSLSVCARRLHLDEFVLRNLNSSNVDAKGLDTILADAFEALIAAIYLDSGYAEAKKFVERQIQTALQHGAISTEDENFKSQLLEYSQSVGLGMPRYETIQEEGPDHDRTFTVEVYLNNDPCGVGLGKSKKDAEQAAAQVALQKLHIV